MDRMDTHIVDQQSSHITFPVEIYYRIFSFLSPEKVFQCERVSKEFQSISKDVIFTRRKTSEQTDHEWKRIKTLYLAIYRLFKNNCLPKDLCIYSDEKKVSCCLFFTRKVYHLDCIAMLPVLKSLEKKALYILFSNKKTTRTLEELKILPEQIFRLNDSAVLSSSINYIVTRLLFQSIENKDEYAVRYFLRIGCNPNISLIKKGVPYRGLIREIPLINAVALGSLSIVEALWEFGADVDMAGENEYAPSSLFETSNVTQITPLTLAAYLDRVDILKFLLDHGANPNAMTNDQRTPLLIAAQFYNKKCVDTLIAYRADVNAKNCLGYTPLDYVGNPFFDIRRSIAKILRQNGGKYS